MKRSPHTIDIWWLAIQHTVAAKTVALDADAYGLLLRSKRTGETFSEVVRRKLQPPSRISDLAGSLSDVPGVEWEEIVRERVARRRRDTLRRKRMERGARSS